jgi:hypothetical protein
MGCTIKVGWGTCPCRLAGRLSLQWYSRVWPGGCQTFQCEITKSTDLSYPVAVIQTNRHGTQQILHAALATTPLGRDARVCAAKIADKGQAGRLICPLPRAATTTKWLAAKMPPAISSCKIHVVCHYAYEKVRNQKQ